MSIIKIYSSPIPKSLTYLNKLFDWTKEICYYRLIIDDRCIFTGFYDKRYIGKKYYLLNNTILNLLAEILNQCKRIVEQNPGFFKCEPVAGIDFKLIQEIDTDKFIKRLSGIKRTIFKGLVQDLQEYENKNI